MSPHWIQKKRSGMYASLKLVSFCTTIFEKQLKQRNHVRLGISARVAITSLTCTLCLDEPLGQSFDCFGLHFHLAQLLCNICRQHWGISLARQKAVHLLHKPCRRKTESFCRICLAKIVTAKAQVDLSAIDPSSHRKHETLSQFSERLTLISNFTNLLVCSSGLTASPPRPCLWKDNHTCKPGLHYELCA